MDYSEVVYSTAGFNVEYFCVNSCQQKEVIMPAINTPYATLSFANLFTPRPRSEGSEPVYSCALLFDKTQQASPRFKALQNAWAEAARNEWGNNVNLKQIKSPFRDAGEKAYEGYHPGDIFISSWSKNKPGIVDRNGEDILLPEEVWSGQLVRANVMPFAWTHSGKRGVSFGLNHVQVIESEGRQRLDGRPSARSAFDDGEVKGDDTPF
jgi:ssDNA-binding protein